MIKNSLIISWFLKMCTVVRDMYLNSGYYKLYIAISDFFAGCFRKSSIYRAFTKPIKERPESLFEKCVNGFFGFFHNMFHKFCVKTGKAISESACGRLCSFLVENWQHVSVRYYSIMLLAGILLIEGFRLFVYCL